LKAGRSFRSATLPSIRIHHSARCSRYVLHLRDRWHQVGPGYDLGYMPESVKHHLRGCDGLMVESNPTGDAEHGPDPWSVKQGACSHAWGTRRNDASGEFSPTVRGGAAFVVLANLFRAETIPEIARIAAENAARNPAATTCLCGAATHVGVTSLSH